MADDEKDADVKKKKQSSAPLADEDAGDSEDTPKKNKKKALGFKKIIASVKIKTVFIYRFLKKNFRPTWPTTLFTVSVIVLLSIAATWQIHGFYKTKMLIAKIERNTSKERISLPPASMLGEADVYDYRPVEATGEMMFLNSMNWVDQDYKDQDGYHVLTPLRLDNGEIVLVDRGWVKDGQKPNNTYWKTTDITVAGTARIPDEKGWFTSENNPKENQWHWIDLQAMAQNAGVIKFYPLVIAQDRVSDSDDSFPIGGQTEFDIPNRHYKYAIACFIAGGIFFFVWCAYSIQQGLLQNSKDEEEADSSDDGNDKDDKEEKKGGEHKKDDKSDKEEDED